MASVVFDNGSYTTKIGFNEDDYPKNILPTSFPLDGKIGPSSIIKRGSCVDMSSLESLWEYSFQLLNVHSKEISLFLSEPPFSSTSSRLEKMDVIFNTFSVPSLYISPQAILPLYGSGEVTGVVFECGAGQTYTTSIFNSTILPTSVFRYDFGGQDITQCLATMLEIEKGCVFKSSYNYVQNTIKEKLCYIALDYENEVSISTSCNILQESYELPDGTNLSLNQERFKVSEFLFRPQLGYLSIPGIHEMIHQSIMYSAIDTRRELCKKIILSGGTTMIPGLEDRLHQEIKRLFNSNLDVQILSSPDRNLLVWIGGAVLSSLSSFDSCWISKSKYEEYGPSALSIP